MTKTCEKTPIIPDRRIEWERDTFLSPTQDVLNGRIGQIGLEWSDEGLYAYRQSDLAWEVERRRSRPHKGGIRLMAESYAAMLPEGHVAELPITASLEDARAAVAALPR